MVTEEVQKARVYYWERIRDVDTEKLVFIDESGLWVGIRRPVARARKGKKVYEMRKSYRGQKMTMICAIKLSGVVATKTLEGSMKKDDFLKFIT